MQCSHPLRIVEEQQSPVWKNKLTEQKIEVLQNSIKYTHVDIICYVFKEVLR